MTKWENTIINRLINKVAFLNRFKTIIGNDATFVTAVSRLIFYAKVSNPLKKIYRKLFSSPNISNAFIPLFANEQEQRLWSVIAKNKEEEKPTTEAYIIEQQLAADLLPKPNGGFYVQFISSGNPLVSIIIPTKNKSELVQQCIDSIVQKTTYPHIEILLIDHRSDEQALFALIEKYKHQTQIVFKHIPADIEFNFSALMNMGIEKSSGDYLVLLNNDTEIISPQWIEYMLGFAQQEKVGAVGCKLLYPNQTIQHAGVVLDAETISKHVFVGKERYDEEVNSIQLYPAVTAACLMINKQKLITIGGFDEQFKVEYNDIDLCLSLLNKNYHNVYLPQVEIFHYESASRRHPFSDRNNYQRHLTERLIMKQKWEHYLPI